MIKVKTHGDYTKTYRFLNKSANAVSKVDFDRIGQLGIQALANATPVDTGLTAKSWTYKVVRGRGRVTVSFHNTNIQNGVPIAIILQYGHATRNGGWVEGRDYINPAVQPLFDKIANDAWREVTTT